MNVGLFIMTNIENEIWKDIPNYEGLYQVSTIGRVKMLSKLQWNGFAFHNIKEKILKTNISNNGYYILGLSKNKTRKTIAVHKLMAITFLNHTPNKFVKVIDHIDNDKTNNNLNNLQIITNRENSCKDKKSKSGNYCIYLNCGSFLVRMRVGNKKKSIGTFKRIEEAIAARDNFINNLN